MTLSQRTLLLQGTSNRRQAKPNALLPTGILLSHNIPTLLAVEEPRIVKDSQKLSWLGGAQPLWARMPLPYKSPAPPRLHMSVWTYAERASYHLTHTCAHSTGAWHRMAGFSICNPRAGGPRREEKAIIVRGAREAMGSFDVEDIWVSLDYHPPLSAPVQTVFPARS